jgi:predicted Zn-dependent protease
MAKSEGKETTGHAACSWSGFFTTGNAGIYTPTNQIIEPRNNSIDDLICDTKEGVLVRRIRGPGPNGGTIMPDIIRMDSIESWRITNGEIIGPANPIRFTGSLVESLADIEIGDITSVKNIGSFVIPAIKINSLNISQPSIVMFQ